MPVAFVTKDSNFQHLGKAFFKVPGSLWRNRLTGGVVTLVNLKGRIECSELEQFVVYLSQGELETVVVVEFDKLFDPVYELATTNYVQ